MKFVDRATVSLSLELECIGCGALIQFISDCDDAIAANVDPSKTTEDGMVSIDDWIELAGKKAEKATGWVADEHGLLCNVCKDLES